MAKLLCLTANPKPAEYSVCLTLGETFLNEYKKNNPSDTVEVVDLVTADFPDIDYTVMGAYGKLMQGVVFTDLTAEEQTALGKRQAYIDQFLSADKVVFVTPLWEFSTPSYVKKYLDVITANKITFKYLENGVPVGLLFDKGIKALHIQSSGGKYTTEMVPTLNAMGGSMILADNFGNKHLQAVLAFLGITDYSHVYAHSTNMGEELRNASVAVATEQAIELAKTF